MRNLQIEINARYIDNNFDFIENLEKLEESVYQYTSCGKIDKLEEGKNFFTIKRTNKKSALVDALAYINGNCKEWLGEHNKDELEEMIYDLPLGDWYATGWSRENSIWNLLDVTLHFERIVSKGYSQGDIVEIIVPHSLAKVWGISVAEVKGECEDGSLNEELSHYMWDMPLSGDFSISFECVTHKVGFKDRDLFDVCSNSSHDYKFDIDSDLVIDRLEKQMIIPLKDKYKKIIKDKLSAYNYSNIKYEYECA